MKTTTKVAAKIKNKVALKAEKKTKGLKIA